RRLDDRGRGLLRDGRRLPRFRPALSLHVGLGLLRNPGQEEPRLQPPLVPARGQDDRTAERSDDCPERPQDLEGLPRAVAADRLLRSRDQEAIRLLYQPSVAGIDDRTDLQVPMADRGVHTQDQATLENQILLWDVPQRREDPGLDRCRRVRAGGDRSEGAEIGAQHGRNLANLEYLPLRENPYS